MPNFYYPDRWLEDAVKNRNWLTMTEYLLLIGTGVGTVATIVFQQLVFTAAPVSVLFLLNLVSRRRIEESAQEQTEVAVLQLDRKVSTELGTLQKQVQALPSFLDLASLRKTAAIAHQEPFSVLSQEVEGLKQELEKPEWRSLHQTVRQLREQYGGLAESVASITTQLNQLSAPAPGENLEPAIAQLKMELTQLRVNVETLGQEQQHHHSRQFQEQIDHVNRRLNQLPQPFDASALKQDIDSLIKLMGDMATRRELSRLVGQIEQISRQNVNLEQSVTPIRVATTILKKQLDTIATKLEPVASPDAQVLTGLQTTVSNLEQRLNQLTAPDAALGRSPNQAADIQTADIQAIVSSYLGDLQQQLSSVQQMAQSLDRQQQDLRGWVTQLPQSLDSGALQNQLRSLAVRVDSAADVDVQAQVNAAIESRLDTVMQQLQSSRPVPEYELVFDVLMRRQQPTVSGCSSRSILEQTLASAQARLVVVYPYPTPETLNGALIGKFREFLDRQGCLDIGWGHLGNISNGYQPRSLDRRRAINLTEKGYLYEILNQLTELKRDYPDQFRFKVLGTDENFLVCDRSFAILGAQSMPTASVVFPQAAVGLRTINAEVIQELVDRFDDPLLDVTDATAYFKRAITRYDLGDHPGAIADYSEVLQINPHDDVAYNNRALAFYDLGNKHQAIADFGQAVQLNPENFIAHCNRGVIRSELSDKLGAIADYTTAIQLNPDYAIAYFHRGLARTRMRNKLGAIQDYSEVIRLNPQDAMAYFYRGLACTKIGQSHEAIADLQHAAQLFSGQGDSVNYQQTLRTLEKLEKTAAPSSLVINGN